MQCCAAVTQRLCRLKRLRYEDSGPLVKCLSTWDLIFLGVGATLGVGIYVLSGAVARDVAGPSIVLSFLLAGIASALSGLCYAELGARVPKAGSAYVYSYVTVGEGVAFVIGWNLILEYAIGTASVARGYSGYLDSLLNKSMENAFRNTLPINIPYLSPYPDLCAFVICQILSVILAIGVKESTKFNNVFTSLNVCVLLFVVILGLFKSDFSNWHLSSDDLPSKGFGQGGFFPYGFSGTLAGAATCFYGFVGFDAIATTGEETKNPQFSIPVSIFVSLCLVFLGYFGVSAVLTLMVPYYLQDVSAPLPSAFHQVGWSFAGWIVSIGALLGLSTSLLGALFPLPRVIYAMSSDGLLFRWLSHVHSHYQTPFKATILAGLFCGTMAALFELKHLVDMMSIGTLMAYTVVAASVVLLRYRDLACSQSSQDYVVLEKLLPAFPDTDENEEIVNLSDESLHLILSSHAKRKRQGVFFRACLNLDQVKKPTATSMRVSLYLTLVLVSLCVMLAFILTHYVSQLGDSVWPSIWFSVVLMGIVLSMTCLWVQPNSHQNDQGFKVPLVPLIPACAIFVNVYLMMKLSSATWVRFCVWMSVGAVVYGLYGWRHSSEEDQCQEAAGPDAASAKS